MGGYAHSCAILYYLTIEEDGIKKDNENTVKKRLSSANIINVQPFKVHKMEQKKLHSEQQVDEEESVKKETNIADEEEYDG